LLNLFTLTFRALGRNHIELKTFTIQKNFSMLCFY